MKNPSFQFYPGDWQKDPELRLVGHSGKGLLMDAMCLMFESEERGVLISGGVPWSNDEAAASIPGDKSDNLQILQRLLEKRVLKRRERDGAIYCKRMVDDERIRAIRKAAGKQGGNPNLLNQNAKQKPTPSSSSSSSSSELPPNPQGGGRRIRVSREERQKQKILEAEKRL